jgi:hypothetical protein
MNIVTIPLHTTNTLNLRECWQARARRAREHRTATWYALKAAKASYALPCTVTVTRISPRQLDKHDGLPAALKNVVDGIADWMQVKDNDERLNFLYDQRKGKPGEYAVSIEIKATEGQA